MPSFTLLALTGLLLSCHETPESPVPEPTGVARAGGNQTSFVGSFALFDASGSSVPGEEVEQVEWLQDPANPEEVIVFLRSSLNEKQFVGFRTPGAYKFTLQITTKSGRLYSDRFQVSVEGRQTSALEDVNLEILVRCRLGYREGPLTAEKLGALDSV